MEYYQSRDIRGANKMVLVKVISHTSKASQALKTIYETPIPMKVRLAQKASGVRNVSTLSDNEPYVLSIHIIVSGRNQGSFKADEEWKNDNRATIDKHMKSYGCEMNEYTIEVLS